MYRRQAGHALEHMLYTPRTRHAHAMHTPCTPHTPYTPRTPYTPHTHLDELLEVDAARRVLLHGELALLEIEWQLGREAAQVLGHLCSHGVHVPYYMHVHGMNMACACIK